MGRVGEFVLWREVALVGVTTAIGDIGGLVAGTLRIAARRTAA